ncbi:ABC-2 type transporter transmembrane domain-containing protein [Plasmodiophora brassicae]
MGAAAFLAVVALAATTSVVLVVDSALLKSCGGAMLTCQNGGTIRDSDCHGRMRQCPDAFTRMTTCACPPGYTGPECQFSTQERTCPRAQSFSKYGVNHAGPAFLHCDLYKTAMLYTTPLRLRDVRIALKFDLPSRTATLAMTARSMSPMGKSCSASLRLLDCQFSECVEQVSPRGPGFRRVSCAVKACRSCQEETGQTKRDCPSPMHGVSMFTSSAKPFDVDVEYKPFQFDTHVMLAIPLMTVPLHGACRTGLCTPDAPVPVVPVVSTDSSTREPTRSVLFTTLFSIGSACALITIVILCVFTARAIVRLRHPVTSGAVRATGLASAPARSAHWSSPIALSWSGLSVRVRPTRLQRCLSRGAASAPKTLLRPCSGSARVGTLTAIIGPSGSGKSTLLERLAHPDGSVVRLETRGPARHADPRALLSYQVQTDRSALPEQTVWEAVQFSARTRLARGAADPEIDAAVALALADASLMHCADKRIGRVGGAGLSGGERRRLALAQELVADRRLVLLDECTTGQHSAAATDLVRVLRRRATDTQTTVVVVIHTPPADTFALFDQVIVMGRGGRSLFQGAPGDAVRYFEHGDRLFEPGENPWEFIISQVNARDADLPPWRDETSSAIDADDADDGQPTQQPMGISTYRQIQLLCDRSFQSAARAPRLLIGYNVMMMLGGVIGGLVFMNVGADLHGALDRFGYIAVTLMFSSLVTMSNVDILIEQRDVQQRERLSGSYSAFAQFMSILIVDLVPFRVMPALLYTATSYALVGFQLSFQKVFWFASVLILHKLASGAMTLFLSGACRDVRMANFAGVLINIWSVVFGVLVSHRDDGMSVLSTIASHLTYYRYAAHGLYRNEMLGLAFQVEQPVSMQADGTMFLAMRGIANGPYSLVQDMCALIAFILAWLFLAFLALNEGMLKRGIAACCDMAADDGDQQQPALLSGTQGDTDEHKAAPPPNES